MIFTFDDGPSEHTEELLGVLQLAHVKATFFMVGENVDERPDLALRVFRAGHQVGNHSHTHPSLLSLDHENVRRELRECEAALGRAGVPSPTVCRPPYGETDGSVRHLIGLEGMEQVLWDVDPEDWRVDATASGIVDSIRAQLPQAPADPVILLHDGRGDRSETVEAVRRLLT